MSKKILLAGAFCFLSPLQPRSPSPAAQRLVLLPARLAVRLSAVPSALRWVASQALSWAASRISSSRSSGRM